MTMFKSFVAAAALATLSIFEKEDVFGRVSGLASVMAKSLAGLSSHSKVGDIRQKGLMAGIEIVAERETKERFPPEMKIGQKIVRKARERGIILRPLGDVIVLMPPLCITLEELDTLAAITLEAIRQGTAGD